MTVGQAKQTSKLASSSDQIPWLEWLASGIGLVLTVGVFGLLGWQALTWNDALPVIKVQIENVVAVGTGYRVDIRASNAASKTAAQVEIEGRLESAPGGAEVSHLVIDYIPGHSGRSAGLFFENDPRPSLRVRAVGFALP